MDFLDLRTILISYTIVDLICAFVLFILWRQNRGRYQGIGYWLTDFILNFFGMMLLAMRGVIPDIFSILFGNFFIVLGIWVLSLGVEKFYNIKRVQIQNFIAVGLFILFQLYFMYISPSINIRNIVVSSVMVFFCAQIAWILFKYDDQKIKKVTRGLAIVSLIYLALGVLRIIGNIIIPSSENIFDSGIFERVIYLSFQMIYIVLTFFLFLMVNRRLFYDLDFDIQQRRETELELEASQERFIKAFHSSPDAVLISRLSDGKFIDANEKFLDVSGYSKEELIGNTTISLNLWVDPKERSKLVRIMRENGQVRGFEFDGRYRDGKIIRFLYSGVLIRLDNEDCLISYLEDISEKKRLDQITQLRLSLWEFSSNHSTIELMQKTLDEIEKITQSTISFFHVVDEKNNHILLQAWSTNTKEKFCKAEGEGMHYPIEKAGLWGDAVRKRVPVIHNDFAAIPEKNWMPTGHAPIIRELVVPITRGGKVEAVLGIGNKITDYDTKDVEMVYEVSDLVWSIIQENIQEERIVELNSRLEKLAMIDELTGLFNRRAFYIKGNDEILRTKRYQFPLSLIMLDIDRFKRINDTYGHDAGDQALKCLAVVLKRHTREVDIIGRLGGEEFVILLPNTSEESATKLAERLRQAVQEEECIKDDSEYRMTASFGVAFFDSSINKMDDFLTMADTALYKAKNNGRNQVVRYGDLNSEQKK